MIGYNGLSTCDTLQFGTEVVHIYRKKDLLLLTTCCHNLFSPLPRTERKNAFPKCHISAKEHGVISYKTEALLTTTVRNSKQNVLILAFHVITMELLRKGI
jgi:hypothetical protein